MTRILRFPALLAVAAVAGGAPGASGDASSAIIPSSNLQGTGTTIVRIDSNNQQSLFFQGPSGLGLTTALAVLSGGLVLVGSVPTNTLGPQVRTAGGPARLSSRADT